jgi:hypothetical protein
MMTKSANDLLNELANAVRAPVGCLIQITEVKPATQDFPNWAPNIGNLPSDAQIRYDSAVVELQRQNQFIDWEGVQLSVSGNRRTVVRQTTKTITSRKEISAMIVDRVNATAPEKLEGIDINPIIHPVTNWSPGLYWPPSAAGGLTKQLLEKVVSDLQQDFEISE